MSPILADYPRFDAIDPAAIRARFEHDLQVARADIQAIIDNPDTPDFNNTLAAIDRAATPILLYEGIADVAELHLHGDAFSDLAQDLTRGRLGFISEIFQNAPLFARTQQVPLANDMMDAALQARIRQNFFDNGVDLSADAQHAYNDNQQNLIRLSAEFTKNAVASVRGKALSLPADTNIAGIPADAVARARDNAAKAGKDGFVFHLNQSDYTAVMENADNRGLREMMARAHANRAVETNTPVVREITALRRDQANLRGFDTYADMMLSHDRMAGSVAGVTDTLDRVAKPARAAARRELDHLANLARTRDGITDFQPWDVAYYTRLDLEHQFSVDIEALKDYLPMAQVLDGLKAHVRRFFGYEMVERPELPVVAPGAHSYEIRRAGETIGYMQMDMLARPGAKAEGAWACDFRPYHFDRDGQARLPVLLFGMSVPERTDGKPPLMNFDQVSTLFHEVGHLMHAMAPVPYPMLKSFTVAQDFIEVPSTIMENYAREPALVVEYMRHCQTGETVDPRVLESLGAMERHGAGLFLIRQLTFNALDLAAHRIGRGQPVPQDWKQFEADVTRDIRLMEPLGVIAPAFGHLFSGMYAAGYYSYLMAEIVEQDMFASIKDTGDIYNPKLTAIFRDEVLNVGAARDATQFLPLMTGGRTTVRIEPFLQRYRIG